MRLSDAARFCVSYCYTAIAVVLESETALSLLHSLRFSQHNTRTPPQPPYIRNTHIQQSSSTSPSAVLCATSQAVKREDRQRASTAANIASAHPLCRRPSSSLLSKNEVQQRSAASASHTLLLISSSAIACVVLRIWRASFPCALACLVRLPSRIPFSLPALPNAARHRFLRFVHLDC